MDARPPSPATSDLPGSPGQGEPASVPVTGPNSAARLAALTYRELREIAGRCMRSQGSGHTLQPTALVHEAYIRLARSRPDGWDSRTQFLAVAATAMRHVLIDSARRRKAYRRDGGRQVTLVDGAAIEEAESVDVLALDEALTRLEALEARPARVLELRYFGGLEVEEVAEVLGISRATVIRDWRFARAWLRSQLGGAQAGSSTGADGTTP